MAKKRKNSDEDQLEKQDLKGLSQCFLDAPSEEALNQLRDFLRDCRDSSDLLRDPSVESRLVPALLGRYSAGTSSFDQAIYEILTLLEKSKAVDLSVFFPLVWGKDAEDNYNKLRELGSSLHTKPNPDKILSKLDGRRMWITVLHHDDPRYNEGDLYDVRFLLRLFVLFLQPGSELSCRLFVTSNALSLVFSCTSSPQIHTRKIAYLCLQLYLNFLGELSTESFEERSLYVYVIRLLKNSVDSEAPRLPHVMSHFFARVSKLLLNPADPVYGPILAFLTLKSHVDVHQVPELYKLLLSTSSLTFQAERNWILQLIKESTLEPRDYAVLQNRSTVKLCLALFASGIVDQTSRRLILTTLKSLTVHPSVCHDLCQRMNILSWITLTIQKSTLSRWEQLFLGEIFVLLLEGERHFVREEGPKANILPVAQICSRKMLEYLDSGKEKTSKELKDRLDDVLQRKWKKRKTA